MKDSEHARKIREAGIRRFGSEQAWREFMRQAANKSRRNRGGTGGFAWMKAKDPKRHKEISRKGGEHGKSVR